MDGQGESTVRLHGMDGLAESTVAIRIHQRARFQIYVISDDLPIVL